MELDPRLIERFEKEMAQFKAGEYEGATIQLHPIVAFAIITQVQIASRHPANKSWYAEQAKRACQQMQEMFNPFSATCKILDMGWNLTGDFEPSPEEQVKHHFQAIGQLIVEELNKQDPDSQWEVWGDGSSASI